MSGQNTSGLGGRVRQLREARGWSQSDLAEKLPGVKQQSVDQLEQGKVARPRFLPELAQILHTSVQWLLTGDGSPTQQSNAAEQSIDAQLLRDVMIAVENVLAQQKSTLDNKHRAEMIAVLYDMMRHENINSPEKMQLAANNIISYNRYLKRDKN
jgi:transcriptional regulator with XRE-family HTH domain